MTKDRFILLAIVLITLFLRFYNYQNRWTLNQDQSRDAVIALYAISSHQLPLLGPPSSAGSFSFGPLYYWIIILFTYFIPLVNGPWIGFSLLSTCAVIIAFLFGKQVGGVTFATIIGLIFAFSSANIFHAPDMLNPMLVGFSTIIAFYCSSKILKTQSLILSLLLGFSVASAISFHLQALGLVFLVILLLLVDESKIIKKIQLAIFIILGIVLALSSLIYFDLKNNYVWIKSVAYYFLHGQDKFNIHYSLPGDIIHFWPQLWGEAITNIPATGYFFLALFIISLLVALRNKIGFSRTWLVIFLTFIAQVVILKFYKGPRLPVYLLVYHPFLLFLTSWTIWVFWKLQKFIGILLLIITLTVSLYSDWGIINSSTQTASVFKVKGLIEKMKPGQMKVYSYDESNSFSLPLYYLFSKEGKIGENGNKVGICQYSIKTDPNTFDYIENCPDRGNLILDQGGIRIFDLSNLSPNDLNKLTLFSNKAIYGWLNSNYKVN